MGEMEEASVDHFIHEHPLTLIQTDNTEHCYGCGRNFWDAEAYGCKKCGNQRFLHDDCAERPREVKHIMHPQHKLVQRKGDRSRPCVVCELKIGILGYFCTSSECEFQIHVRCAHVVDVVAEQISIEHPSHPQHHLALVNKSHSFKCDACGTMEMGRSYVCVVCHYWIHEDCAALRATADYHHHHHHPLSLAYYLPIDYFKLFARCDVCRKRLPLHRWVYHCQICRYVVHIKCAINPPIASNGDANGADDQGVIQFPFEDVHEELIKPFVIRERGEMVVTPCNNKKYCFPLHHHQLSLVSSSSSSVSEINDDDDEEEMEDELTCDACTMPIFQRHKSSSSSSSSSQDYYKYMSCGECKYFLHLMCFNLPPELPSHPLHKPHHNLILEACPKLNFWTECSTCDFLSNGLRYACRECHFILDIKCASLPTTIKHQAHPHHHLHLKSVPMIKDTWQGLCGGCDCIIFYGVTYKCGSCDFILCNKCILLPLVNKHKWEKHTLPLRYDARFNHPGDFYCDACEGEMNPMAWMYHCRDCDTSFHPSCFPAASGDYQNVKFGQQYKVSGDLHPHPLTFRLLTTKLRCDVCRITVYGADGVDQRGFHCSSCNFFMCLDRCGRWRRTQILPID